MSEREPEQRPWNIAAITEFLTVAAEATGETAFGEGLLFRLGRAAKPVSVEFFSGASVARIITPNTEVTLRGITQPAVEDGELVLARPDGEGNQRAALSADGELSLTPRSVEDAAESAERSTAAVTAAELRARQGNLERAIRMLTNALDRCGGDDISCPDCGPAQVFAAELLERGSEPASKPEQERLTITGRVGTAPAFRTTRNGVVIARFPVAVRRDDGGTTWQTIAVFGDKAERLRESLQKGQTVQVIGYVHEREVSKRDGTARIIKEIYAAVVRTR